MHTHTQNMKFNLQGIVAPIGNPPPPPPPSSFPPRLDGGAATNIKVCGPSHKRLWNINGCVVLFLPFSPYLNHPTLLLRFPPSPTARMSRTRSRRSHFLFFITGTCYLFVCFIIGRLRSSILSFITGRLCSCHLICVIGSVTAFTSGPSSTCGKKILIFFENLKLFKKPQATFKSQNSRKYIYIIAKMLTLSQYSYK